MAKGDTQQEHFVFSTFYLLKMIEVDSLRARSFSRVDVPLWCAVAASNELPESDELEALFDRFLLRREAHRLRRKLFASQVPRVSDAAVPSFLRSALEAEERDVDDEPMLTVLDSSECQRKSSETKFPGHLLDVVEPWLERQRLYL